MKRTREQMIAEMAKRDNLDMVNQNSEAVHPKKCIYEKYMKRLLDILMALPLVIILSPVYTVLALLVYFDLGSPVIFKQKRTGKNGKAFNLIKFRSMTNETDGNGHLLPEAERTTKLGKFIRKYSLDELVSIWLILKGDMSVIGPRPLPVTFEDRYSQRHRARCAVKPGLECPSIHTDGHIRLYQEQFENDIWYVEHVSFLVDCRMILGLVRMVFNHKERSDHAQVGGGAFVGYDENGQAFSMRRIPEKYEKEYELLSEREDCQ